MTHAELVTAEPVGLTQRLEHCAIGVDSVRQDTLAAIAATDAEIAQAAARVDAPFGHGDRLTHLRQRHAEIQALLMPADDSLLDVVAEPDSPVVPPGAAGEPPPLDEVLQEIKRALDSQGEGGEIDRAHATDDEVLRRITRPQPAPGHQPAHQEVRPNIDDGRARGLRGPRL
jgi:hypothetical protein